MRINLLTCLMLFATASTGSNNLNAQAKKEEPKKAVSSAAKELPEPGSLKWKKARKMGDKLMQKGGVYNAVRYYEAAISKKATKKELYQRAADANFLVRDYNAANREYKTGMDFDSIKHKNPYLNFQYALTLKYQGKYEQAIEAFKKFNRIVKDDEKLSEYRKQSTREIAGCELGIKFRDSVQEPDFKVAHLDENINQPFTDYAPYLINPNTLIYGSWTSDAVSLVDKTERYTTFSRIYSSRKTGRNWSKGEQVPGPVNTVNAHTGNAITTADGKTMYYTQCVQDEMSRMRCSIYKSTVSSEGWSIGDKLEPAVNAEGTSNTHPAFGKNEAGEDVLYYSSDRNTGKGMDIYYAKINPDGSFAKGRSVGPAINTKGDEICPSYDFKTNTLYFSSNGRINIGGFDIYKTKVAVGEWLDPENLGMPVNSSVDDMYFRWKDEDNTGFVVSNRTGGFSTKSETCCDDIYAVEKFRLHLALKGKFLEDADKSILTSGIANLVDNESGKELKSYYITDGTYFFDLEPERKYRIAVKKGGYEDAEFVYSTSGKKTDDTATYDFSIKKIPVDTTPGVGSRIGVVYWEYDKHILTDGSPDTLANVVAFMGANPQFILEVGSHTDSKGDDKYNMALSQRRSDSVLKFLTSKKVPKFRLVSKAYGETMPVDLNEDPEGVDNPNGRTKNRRTEFKIIEILPLNNIK